MGYDAGKKVKGRKIHALVDTEGLPLRVVVHSAAIQDLDGAALVLDRIWRFRLGCDSLSLMGGGIGDGGSSGGAAGSASAALGYDRS